MVSLSVDGFEDILLPSHQSEIELRRFFDFKDYLISVGRDKESLNLGEIVKGISLLTGIEEDILLRVPYFFNDERWGSLCDVFEYLVDLVSAEPDSMELPVIIDGEEWTISKLLGKVTRNDCSLTVGETVEWLHIEKEFEVHFEEIRKCSVDGFIDYQSMSNLHFDLSLIQMALIFRKRDEVLPYETREMVKFVTNRVEYFKGRIDYSIYNKVAFFLRCFLKMLSLATGMLNTSIFGLGESRKNLGMISLT